jgi:streptomycin 3"-adenylyltransferase
MQFGWQNSPEAVRDQIERFVRECRELLGEDLSGVYLHGSLAMGSFNPKLSDLDVLVLSERRLSQQDRRSFAQAMLSLSGDPHPVEMSVLWVDALHPWQHPAPYEYHFSEDWRERQHARLTDSAWGEPETATDPDLAAHLVIARERGVTLFGTPARQALPEIPTDDYIDALLYDYDSAKGDMLANPVYSILNVCRVYWYLVKSAISSKTEAGEWAQAYLPDEYRGVVMKALRAYRSDDPTAMRFDHDSVLAFAAYIDEQVRQLL